MCILGYCAYRDCKEACVDPSVTLLAIMLVVIGVGSAAFHATLSYTSQLLDEVPMILALSLFLVCLSELKGKNWRMRYSLLGYASVFTVLHCLCGFTLAFQVAMMTLISAGGGWLRHHVHGAASSIHGQALNRTFVRHAALALVGWFMWMSDNSLCGILSAIGNPQFHAWWHVMIAASYHQGVAVLVLLHLEAESSKKHQD